MHERYKQAINLILVYCGFVSVFGYGLPLLSYFGFELPFYNYFKYIIDPILAIIFFLGIGKIAEISKNKPLKNFNKLEFYIRIFFISINIVFIFFVGEYLFLNNPYFMQYYWIFGVFVNLILTTYMIKIHFQLAQVFSEKYFIFYGFMIGFDFLAPFIFTMLSFVSGKHIEYMLYGVNIFMFMAFLGYAFTWIKLTH